MSWLTPPTDNLYKFMAIFGIVLVVTGFLMERQSKRSFDEALRSLMVEEAKAGNEELAQARRILGLTQQFSDIDPKAKDGFRQQQKLLQEMRAPELHRSHEEFESSESYIRAKHTYDEAKAEYLDSNKYVLLSIAGAVLSAAGFYLWFTKLQHLLDQQIAAAGGQAHPVKQG